MEIYKVVRMRDNTNLRNSELSFHKIRPLKTQGKLICERVFFFPVQWKLVTFLRKHHKGHEWPFYPKNWYCPSPPSLKLGYTENHQKMQITSLKNCLPSSNIFPVRFFSLPLCISTENRTKLKKLLKSNHKLKRNTREKILTHHESIDRIVEQIVSVITEVCKESILLIHANLRLLSFSFTYSFKGTLMQI